MVIIQTFLMFRQFIYMYSFRESFERSRFLQESSVCKATLFKNYNWLELIADLNANPHYNKKIINNYSMEYRVGYDKLISNTCEWNNCFIKYQTLDKNTSNFIFHKFEFLAILRENFPW